MFAPRFSVIDGRPSPRARLCDTCMHGVVMSGEGEDEEQVFCLLIASSPEMDVVSCNRYTRDGGSCPAARAAHEAAWVA